jgi:hypothetical protein
VTLSSQGYNIVDLGSTNGTFVNEQRLIAHMPRLLNVGDKIRIGDTVLTYQEVNTNQVPWDFTPTRAADPNEAAMLGSGQNDSRPTIAAGQEDFMSTIGASQDDYPTYAGFGRPSAGRATPPVQPPVAPTTLASQSSMPLAPQSSYGWSSPSSPMQPPSYGLNNLSAPPPAMPSTPFQQPSASSAIPPAYPYSSPQIPQFPPAVQGKAGGKMRIWLIVLIVVVVLGLAGGGTAIFLLTRLQPTISLTSNYKVGTTPAGSTSTILRITGHKFSGNSAITFLLDQKNAPGAANAQSDANGDVTANLTITDGWTVGNHTLTAKDAGGYTTQTGVAITIVTQGQAHTPGPNGAPSDDASFMVNATLQTTSSTSTINEVFAVTGKPDPAGGTVCGPLDDGHSHSTTGNLNGFSYTRTVSFTCSGSYKAGKLSYTETATSDTITFSVGLSCTKKVPYVYQSLQGTFSSNNVISGTFTTDPITTNCNGGLTIPQMNAISGAWTGLV